MPLPVLVTGSHRSGTTWVGRMLCASKEFAYVHEPFNIGINGPSWTSTRVPYWFFHLCAENADAYDPWIREVLELRYRGLAKLRTAKSVRHLARLGRDWSMATYAKVKARPALIKDPIALFSAEWLAERHGLQVVVMVRNPLAFAGSLKRLNWQFDFNNWLRQDLLMKRYLQPFSERIRHFAQSQPDIVDQAILLWTAMYWVVEKYQERHPNWHFVRHEDLAHDPLRGFRELYRGLGLTWSDGARSVVSAYSRKDNVKDVAAGEAGTIKRDSSAALHTWKNRLSPDEVKRVRDGVGLVAGHFYPEAW